MPNEIIVEIASDVLQETNLGINGLQENLQNKICNTGKSVAEVVEEFRNQVGVLNDSDVVDRDIDDFMASMNNNDCTHYYLILREPTRIKESPVNTLPPKSITQKYVFVIGDHHPILASFKTTEGTEKLCQHLKMLVEQHSIDTIYNLIKQTYGNSISQLRSVFNQDQLMFGVFLEQYYQDFTYQHQPYVFKIAAELKPKSKSESKQIYINTAIGMTAKIEESETPVIRKTFEQARAEAIAEVLSQAQDQYEGETQVVEKTFEQQMADVPEIPYAQLAFIDHIQDRVKEDVPDMDDYHKVMNTLWRIFCTGGWDRDDESYLECVDRFRGRFEPNCDMAQVEIGSQVQLMSGEIHTVENFMWLNPLDLFNEDYKLAIKFVDKNEAKTYTETGWHDTNHKYNMDNIVSVDGKAEN